MPIALGVAFFVLVQCVGHAVLRLARLQLGLLALGVAGPLGLACLAVVATWSAAFGLPAWLPLALACLLVLASLVLLWRPSAMAEAAWKSLARDARLGVGLLGAALALSTLLMAFGFAGVDAPLSTHDGSFHVELIDAARNGRPAASWYPSGLHLSIAALLAVLPWIDSAAGAFGATIGLSLMGVAAVFGLSFALFRSPVVAGAAAMMVAITFQFPYHFHFWSGWPLASTIILTLGVWSLAFEYLAQARLRLAIILGLLASGIVLVHGTEVYTTLIGLAVLGLACWREIPVRRTSAHAVLAAALAIGLAGPYMPFLLHWAAGGGASEIRDAAVEVAGLNPAATDLFDTFGSGVGLDLPLRLALLTVGTVAALRSTGGRIVTTIGALFFLLAFAFTTMHLAVLDTIYAVTFPWGQSYRLLMLTAIAAAVLQGAGSVWIACWYARLRARARLGAALLRLATTLVAGLCIVFGAGSALSEALLLAANARVYASTTPDDAIAMAWLRSHAAPGDLVANDRYSDAGIWAPFKAGTPVVLTRLASDRLEERQLVLDDIGRLDQAAEAQSAACELDVRYVFHGSTATLWEPRHFPPLPELQQSPALDEVFSSGEATIFKTRLPCH